MDSLLAFNVAMLRALADFLGTEPIIYLFGMVLLLYACKAFKTLMP